jgi:hypothetical protein
MKPEEISSLAQSGYPEAPIITGGCAATGEAVAAFKI